MQKKSRFINLLKMQMWEGKKIYFQLSLWKGSEAKQKVGFPITPQKYLYKEILYVKTLVVLVPFWIREPTYLAGPTLH